MTLVSDIITSGLRESNAVGRTQPVPAGESAEALARLEAIVFSCLGNDVGYILEDWNVASSTSITKPSGVPLNTTQITAFTIPPNARFACALTGAVALTLNPQPQDGERFSVMDTKASFAAHNLTLHPNGRKLAGGVADVVLSTNGAINEYFYRADIGDWKLIAPLDPANEFLFPEDFDDFFIISLAMRMNPRYGVQLSPESKATLDQQKSQITARYSQTRLNVGSIQTAPPAGAQQ